MARVLLVDDEETVRAPLARVLAMEGHAVDQAGDGGEALDRLGAPGATYDLLISDIRMPVMDGIALTLSVAARHPGVKILLMTGYAEQRERAAELQGLVEDVLTKPFALDAFRAAVRKAVGGTP